MWGLLFFVCLVVSCTASKEYAARGNLDFEESKLLLEIVKRLQDNQFSHHDRSQEEETEKDSTQSGQCEVSTKQSLIIKKKDSEKSGATFLSLFKDVLKNDDCSNLCCQNASCDLAVYENKDDHYCYLFRCNGKCVFGKHSSYTSNDIIHHKQSDNAAQDLDGIVQEHENDNSEEVAKGESSTTPIAKTFTATVANELLQAIRAHSVGLDGMCQNDIHCEDPNAECKNRHCICQENFYKKNRICRKVCPPSNFECVDLGTHGRGPQCVMQSQVCDGTTHCADGTDEYNCPDTGIPPIKTWQQYIKPQKSQQQEQYLEQSQTSHDLSPQHFQELQNLPEQSQLSHQPVPQKSSKSHLFLQSKYQPHISDTENSYHVSHSEHDIISETGNSGESNQKAVAPPLDDEKNAHDYPNMPKQHYEQSQQNAELPHYPSYGQASEESFERLPGTSMQQSPSSDGVKNGNNGRPEETSVLLQENQASIGSALQTQLQTYALNEHQKQHQQSVSLELPQQSLDPHGHPLSGGSQSFYNPEDTYPSDYSKTLEKQKILDQSETHVPLHQYAESLSNYDQLQESTESRQSQNRYGSAVTPKQQDFLGFHQLGQSLKNVQSSSQPNDDVHLLPTVTTINTAKLGQNTVSQDSQLSEHLSHIPNHSKNPDVQQHQEHKLLTQPQIYQAAHQVSSNQIQSKSDVQQLHLRPKVNSVDHPSILDKPKSRVHVGKELDDSKDSADVLDTQRAYIVPEHPRIQELDYKGFSPDLPEKTQTHSAYDVRVGGPSLVQHKGSTSQKSHSKSGGMHEQDLASPFQILDQFVDRYPQRPLYGLRDYPRGYQSPYLQQSGSQDSRLQGFAEQLYPSLQGHGTYPQQGYLGLQDPGYPSQYNLPQYEFGEFEPAYPEAENYPSGSDMSAYHPDYKLGAYDTSIKTKTDADKPSKQVQHHLSGERDEESSNTDASDSQAESPEDNHPADNKPNNTSMHATNPDNINHNGNIQDQTDVDAKSQENRDSYLGMVDSAKHRISEDTKDPAIDKSKLVVTQSPQMDSKPLPSSTDDHVNYGHIDTISNVKEKFSENVDKSHNTAGAAHSAETGTGSHDHFIIQEEIQMPEAQSESMQGPIIALALGLAFTFILLVFVACRLRTVRQRLRKGRPLHSNEADYLINGMYL